MASNVKEAGALNTRLFLGEMSDADGAELTLSVIGAALPSQTGMFARLSGSWLACPGFVATAFAVMTYVPADAGQLNAYGAVVAEPMRWPLAK